MSFVLVDQLSVSCMSFVLVDQLSVS